MSLIYFWPSNQSIKQATMETRPVNNTKEVSFVALTSYSLNGKYSFRHRYFRTSYIHWRCPKRKSELSKDLSLIYVGKVGSMIVWKLTSTSNTSMLLVNVHDFCYHWSLFWNLRIEELKNEHLNDLPKVPCIAVSQEIGNRCPLHSLTGHSSLLSEDLFHLSLTKKIWLHIFDNRASWHQWTHNLVP